jgi:hypothetical protein
MLVMVCTEVTVPSSMDVGTTTVAGGNAAVSDGDVVLLIWPCDRVGVSVNRDGDRVAKDTVTDGDADVDIDADLPSTVGDSVRREPVSDNDGVPLIDTDGE